jgi:hypothetical protein
MGHTRQIAHEAGKIGWQRIVVTTVIGTLVTVALDHFGLVSKLAGLLPGRP